MVEKIFFQSSLPRSGSTLFQNIMGQNPDFYVTPTSGVLELLYGARANYTNSPEFKAQDPTQMKIGFNGFCKNGMFGFFNSVTDRKYVLDKSRGWGVHYNFINGFYPDPKIVCLVRDLRSIFSSMEKKFRQNQHKDSGLVDHAKMQGTTTEKRIDIWANSQPVGLAIERLSQILREGIGKKMLFIRYEDLTSNPARELQRVYEYFNLPVYSHDFESVHQVTKEDDEVYGIYGDHSIRTKIEPTTPDYKEILGVPASNWIKTTYKWFYDEFKYY